MASIDSSSHSTEIEQKVRKCPDDASNGSHSRSSHSQSSSDVIVKGRASFTHNKTKFVVRKIPKFVTQDTIKSHLDEFSNDFTWFFWTQQPDIPNPTRRAKTRYNRFYIRFISFQAAIPFVEKFQKLTFKEFDDEKSPNTDSESKSNSNEISNGFDRYNYRPNVAHKLCIEFAPNQGVPVEIPSRDRRINTIDADEDYKAFVQGLVDQEAKIKDLRRSVEANSMRTAQVIAVNNKDAATADAEPNDQTDIAKDAPIAPLAKHVASQRHRSLVIVFTVDFFPFEFLCEIGSYLEMQNMRGIGQILAKKITRSTLIKSERAKERRMEKVRETRRRKRAALAARGKNKKYRTAHWIAKHAENYDDNEPVSRSSRKHSKSGRSGRFAPKKAVKKRRFKVNPKYMKKYADQHDKLDVSKSISPRSSKDGSKADRVRDPEAYDARDRRDWAMKRRPRKPDRGSRARRGRGKGSSARREKMKSVKSVKSRRSKKNGYGDHEEENGHNGSSGGNGTVEAFNGYSRKRGHQTWQRAR